MHRNQPSQGAGEKSLPGRGVGQAGLCEEIEGPSRPSEKGQWRQSVAGGWEMGLEIRSVRQGQVTLQLGHNWLSQKPTSDQKKASARLSSPL